MRFILIVLLLLSLNSWADVTDVFKSKEERLEEIVADTFSDDEFIQWLEIRDRYNTKEKEENDQQLACVAKGKHAKTCVDPHWCLYPDNLKTKECSKYRRKYSL